MRRQRKRERAHYFRRQRRRRRDDCGKQNEPAKDEEEEGRRFEDGSVTRKLDGVTPASFQLFFFPSKERKLFSKSRESERG